MKSCTFLIASAIAVSAIVSVSLSLLPQPGIASPRSCQTNQLSIRRASGNAGEDNRAVVYAFTNISQSNCILNGYPQFGLLDANDQPLPDVEIQQSPLTYFGQARPPKPVLLFPGEQASFWISYSGIPAGRTCLESSKVTITPPNADHPLVLDEQLEICGERVRVTPIQAKVIP